MKEKLIIGLIATMLAVSAVSFAASLPRGYENGNGAALDKFDDTFPDCGKNVCKKEFVHYGYSQGKSNPAKNQVCYKLMGVKWYSLPVAYTINPANSYGMSEAFVKSAISSAAEEWDAYTSKELFSNYTIDKNAKAGIRNYKNEIFWGNYEQKGVIAVTTVWYNPRMKQITEFDIIMDTDFVWGDGSADNTKMDVQNIATHELGHAIGLSDIYYTSCSSVTMYGYSAEGDVSKRTLDTPDITGLQNIYGI